MDLQYETVIFGGNGAERREAVKHVMKSPPEEGLTALLLKILDHIYELENPP